MPIGKLDHCSVRTLDSEASRRCYAAVTDSQVTIELDYPLHEAAA